MALNTASDNQDLLVEEIKFTRIVTLNRPSKLNAVTWQMISTLTQLLTSYAVDPTVKLVILKGKGRAFSAGGDIPSVVQKVREGGSWRTATRFFRDEFTLDYIIATQSKTQVSILNGVVVGTGFGLSVNGKFRIATEKTLFSMPEALLGVSPNTSGTYNLPRLPGSFGEYLALTGAWLDGAEMLACGVATHFVPSSKLDSLEEALSQVNTSEHRVISLIIDEFSQVPKLKDSSAYNSLDIINKCFSKGTVREILLALETEAEKSDVADWIPTSIQWLKKASPLGLEMTLKALRLGRHQSIEQCLIREHRIMAHALRGEVSKDYLEGCRALFIDKDKSPKWEPALLEQISDEMVEHYFTKLVDEKWEDLHLQANTRTTPTYAIAKL